MNGSKVQSVLFDKRYWSLARAKAKLKSMGYSIDYGVDETAHRYRFRQIPPSRFKDFRTMSVPNTPTIQLVLGFTKPRPSGGKTKGGTTKKIKNKKK